MADWFSVMPLNLASPHFENVATKRARFASETCHAHAATRWGKNMDRWMGTILGFVGVVVTSACATGSPVAQTPLDIATSVAASATEAVRPAAPADLLGTWT